MFFFSFASPSAASHEVVHSKHVKLCCVCLTLFSPVKDAYFVFCHPLRFTFYVSLLYVSFFFPVQRILQCFKMTSLVLQRFHITPLFFSLLVLPPCFVSRHLFFFLSCCFSYVLPLLLSSPKLNVARDRKRKAVLTLFDSCVCMSAERKQRTRET